MDTLLPQLLAFPPHPPPKAPASDLENHKQITALVNTLNSVQASNLVQGVNGGGDLLDILNPALNTLPYLYVLLAHIATTGAKQKNEISVGRFTPDTTLWQKMMDFMHSFDPVQIRYGGTEMRRLMNFVAMNAQKANKPSSAIEPLQAAILRIDPSGATLTSNHISFVTLCLETRNFTSALPILDKDIYFLPSRTSRQAEAMTSPLAPFPVSQHDSSSTYITPSSGISEAIQYQDYLRYFLYGAMIYMALKKWERAQLFLEVVVGCPSMGQASKIQVEAYKKLMLVGLLWKGKAPPKPRVGNNQTIKVLQNLTVAYATLADVFKDGIDNEESPRNLIAEILAGTEIWQEDVNSGLVAQTVDAYKRCSIQHLQKTYSALTIADLARLTSSDSDNYEDTARYIMQMIAAGQLNATVAHSSADPKGWVVSFSESTSEADAAALEEQNHDHVVKQTQRIKSLMEQVRENDRQLGSNKEYVQEMRKAKKATTDGNVVDENNPFANAGAFDQDEDVMADL